MATESQTVATTGLLGIVGSTTAGQRLTITNRVVSKIALYLTQGGTPTGDIYLQIRKTSDGSQVDSVFACLASSLPAIAGPPALTEVTLTTPVLINEEVAIVARTTTGGVTSQAVVWGSNTDVKAGEYLTKYVIGTGFTDYTTQDAGYVYTYSSPPTVTTQQCTSITDTTAVGHGNITSIGDDVVTQHGHCWSTSANPTTADSKVQLGAAGVGTFTSAITGLTAATLYHTRAYATNAQGTSYGEDISFTTSATGAPSVTTQACSDVLQTTATGHGTLVSIGSSAVTQHGHCWSTSVNPTTADSKTTLGAKTAGTFVSYLTSLTVNTLYYVRAYATNTQGTAYGDNVTITTLPNTTKGVSTGFAFGQGIFATPSYTTVSSDIMHFNIKRGRMHELDRIEAGTATLILNNTSGYYWRNNTVSPYYPNMKPLTPVNITVSYNGTSYTLFTGVTESFKPGWVEDRGGKSPTMTVECVDIFKSFSRLFLFASLQVPAGTFPAQLSGDRIVAVLDEMGWPGTGLKSSAYRDIGDGKVTVAAITPPDGGTNAMEHLYAVAEAEGGIIFVSRDGKITFQDRDYRNMIASSATFSDAAGAKDYALPELSDDDTFIYNMARIKGTGAEQVFYDSNSISNIGERAWVKTDSQIENASDAWNQAYTLVARYNDSKLRCQNLLILPDADPTTLNPLVLGYDISTRITLQLNSTDNPAILDQAYHIEGIEHDYDAKTNLLQTKWQLWDVNQYRLFSLSHNGYLDALSIVSYATAQGAANADYVYNEPVTDFVIVGQQVTNVPGWRVLRGYVATNTATLAATNVAIANIANAWLMVHSNGTNAYTIDRAFDLTITNTGGAPSNGIYLTLADYGNIGNAIVSYGSLTFNTPNVAGNTWYQIPLNQNGINTIVTNGTTAWGLRSSKDIAANSPGNTASMEYIAFDGLNSNYSPRLVLKIV